VPEVGSTVLKQTLDFKEAAEECLTKGCEAIQIAACINYGRYNSDQKDPIYDKILNVVSRYRRALKKNNKP
jgi:hypothetical protein